MGALSSFFSREFLKEKKLHNPYYFIGLTCIIATLHIWHVFLRVPSLSFLGIKLTFLALFESILEGSVLCFLATFFYEKKRIFKLVMVLSALDPLIHLIDYILERLFNLSFWSVIESFLHENNENFIEYAYATNLPLWMWGVGLSVLALIPFVFFAVYRGAAACSKKIPINKTLGLCVALFFATFVVYFPFRMTLSPPLSLGQWIPKMLPFKEVFIPKSASGPSQKLKNTGDDTTLKYTSSLGQDVFIFIVESLRNDAINESTAPNLSEVGHAYFRHPNTLAAANGTQLSWYSIFYGKNALNWRDPSNKGSPFLSKFKNEGYQTHILSSTRLSYYAMDRLLFGTNHELIDAFFCPKLHEDMTAFEADLACFNELKKKTLVPSTQKRLFVVFLDATHFGYSLPSVPQAVFTPYAEGIPYFKILFTRFNPELVRARYHNAIYALDQLFGDFFNHLKAHHQWDASTLLFTGDHGEEFLENGQIFHASHLSSQQLHIPCVIKTPSGYEGFLSQKGIFSHEQMFPMIASILSNHSFEPKTSQISVRYLFSKTPSELVISSEEGKAFYSYDASKETLQFKGMFDIKDQYKGTASAPWLNAIFEEAP